jgi:hypothetical protein
VNLTGEEGQNASPKAEFCVVELGRTTLEVGKSPQSLRVSYLFLVAEKRGGDSGGRRATVTVVGKL